jgi:hypothetical protein
MKIRTILILFFLVYFHLVTFSQIIPTPQTFTSVKPIWYYNIKDIDFKEHPLLQGLNQYSSASTQFLKIHKNDVYYYADSRLVDFYGGFLLKFNGENGELEWRYASNHTNAPRPELYQELIIDKNDHPVLSGGQSIYPYKDPLPGNLLLGATHCQYSQKQIDKITGQLLNHKYSTDTTTNPLLIMSTLTPESFFTFYDKLYYRRIEGFRRSLFFPLKEDDLGVQFADTAYITTFLPNYIQGQGIVPNEERLFIDDNTFVKFQNIYSKDSSVVNQGILFKEHFKEDHTIDIEIIRDDLGKYLKRVPNPIVNIPMYILNGQYVFFQYHGVRYPSNPNTELPRIMILWLDAEGNEIYYKSELEVNNNFISGGIVRPIGIIDNKLYLFVSSRENSKGLDIIEIDTQGNTSIKGSIINTDPSMSFSTPFFGFTESGKLICWAIENKFTSDSQLSGGWSTIYAFDPKDLGIPYTSSVQSTTLNHNFKILPNPASDYLKIESDISFEAMPLKCTITSPEGNLIYEFVVQSSSQNININNLNSGLYFCHFSNYKGTIGKPQKVIILR